MNKIHNNLRLVCLVAVVALASSSGCSICCAPYDYDYPTFGSRTPRVDMRNGRVGSILSDPAMVGQNTSHSANDVGEEIVVEELQLGEVVE